MLMLGSICPSNHYSIKPAHLILIITEINKLENSSFSFARAHKMFWGIHVMMNIVYDLFNFKFKAFKTHRT